MKTRIYPDGWDLEFFPYVTDDGLPYVGFLSPDSAIRVADMAEQATGAPMEVFKLPRKGWAYRPAETEVPS